MRRLTGPRIRLRLWMPAAKGEVLETGIYRVILDDADPPIHIRDRPILQNSGF